LRRESSGGSGGRPRRRGRSCRGRTRRRASQRDRGGRGRGRVRGAGRRRELRGAARGGDEVPAATGPARRRNRPRRSNTRPGTEHARGDEPRLPLRRPRGRRRRRRRSRPCSSSRGDVGTVRRPSTVRVKRPVADGRLAAGPRASTRCCRRGSTAAMWPVTPRNQKNSRASRRAGERHVDDGPRGPRNVAGSRSTRDERPCFRTVRVAEETSSGAAPAIHQDRRETGLRKAGPQPVSRRVIICTSALSERRASTRWALFPVGVAHEQPAAVRRRAPRGALPFDERAAADAPIEDALGREVGQGLAERLFALAWKPRSRASRSPGSFPGQFAGRDRPGESARGAAGTCSSCRWSAPPPPGGSARRRKSPAANRFPRAGGAGPPSATKTTAPDGPWTVDMFSLPVIALPLIIRPTPASARAWRNPRPRLDPRTPLTGPLGQTACPSFDTKLVNRLQNFRSETY